MKATAAGTVSADTVGSTARTGHHFVVVQVRVQNVGKFPNCTDFDPWLKVDLGYQYEPHWSTKLGRFAALPPPRISNLLPTEEKGGSYIFEVKDGTDPVALVLVRNTVAETFCRARKNLPTNIPGLKKSELPLQDLPRAVKAD